MTVSLKHAFNNPKSDGGDATVVRPSNWNAEHVLTLDTNRVLGRISSGNGAAEELTGANIRTIANVTEAGVVGGINTRTASYTLVLGDAGKVIEMNVGSANTLTIPLNASAAFPVATQITVIQYGAGQTTIAGAAGVTVRALGGALKTAAQYAAVSLYKRATDEWVVFGSLSTS
jgi:hypothetical protein